VLNLIQKFFKKDRFDKNQVRLSFSNYFFSHPEHLWLNNGTGKRHFEKLFSRLPVGVLEVLMAKYTVVFVPSYELNSRPEMSATSRSTIVIFPEFQKLLKTEKKAAVAYLAHELALLLCELENSSIDPMMIEIEADKFVCDLGLSDELEELLLMLDETIEKRLRLTYLTINHFTNDQN
jgi:hypothetical protein